MELTKIINRFDISESIWLIIIGTILLVIGWFGDSIIFLFITLFGFILFMIGLYMVLKNNKII